MKIVRNSIVFANEDIKFIEKFGLKEATEMVEDFRTHNNLPFIYDSIQLTDFLGLPLKALFKMIRKGCAHFYKNHTIKKKNGGERNLCVPSDALKRAQRRIYSGILSNMAVSKYATAYKKGVDIRKNAKPHLDKRYLLKMDITDFFGSIDFDMVYKTAFNTRYFPKNIGVMLTNLCCYDDYLPQGAPTSPALSNIIMKNFDDNLGRWCEKHGISYTRYCDDMTFSSNRPLYNVYVKTKKMLDEMGFEVNEAKSCFVTNKNRQSVTGITVNEKLSVSKDYKRKLRQQIHYILKYGAANCIAFTAEGFIADDIRPDVLHLLNSVEGKINYVLSVEDADNEYFKNARNQIIKMRENLY